MCSKLFAIAFLLLIFAACSDNCSKLPTSFSSFNLAVYEIRSHSFKLEDSLSCSDSSWIEKIEYFSCNGSEGFLILSTYEKDYLHKDVPYDLWVQLSHAESCGSYYNKNIKNKFYFEVE